MPHRYFTTEISNGTATLRGADAHHLSRVMRGRLGDTVILCDGNAVEYTATITGFGPETVEFSVEPGYPSAAEPSVEVTLFVGYPKQDKLEQVIRHGGGKADDGVCHDVGGDDIVPAAGLVGQVTHQNGQLVSHAVQGGILACGAHGHGVDVHTLGTACAQLEGGNGKDAAAGADVQHPLTAAHPLVQRFQAEAGGLVAAGAKGKAGVKDQLDAVGIVLLPGGHDGQPFANVHGWLYLRQPFCQSSCSTPSVSTV